MVERRRNPRIPITLHLSICDLYRENESLTGLHNLNSPIRLTDISLSGIAFVSECVLPVGYFFNATLDTPNHEDKVFSLVKIIRSFCRKCNNCQSDSISIVKNPAALQRD